MLTTSSNLHWNIKYKLLLKNILFQLKRDIIISWSHFVIHIWCLRHKVRNNLVVTASAILTKSLAGEEDDVWIQISFCISVAELRFRVSNDL